MKFLAILKDSFREAIDAKVFYVLVGLSLLLALLTLSVSFDPQPGGRITIERFAALPLNADASSLDRAETAQVFLATRPVEYDVESAEPLNGAPDAPASAFKVQLQATFRTADEAAKAKADPAALEQHIREQFGLIEGRRMMEATDVHFVQWQGDVPLLGGLFGGALTGTFTLEAHPTPATFRFWPCKMGLFFGAFYPFGEAPLYEQIYLVENLLVGWAGNAVAVLVSIIVTAFFIPNMLRKGSVDLLLVKPINRVVLLLYKFVGGLTFMFLNAAAAVVGVWLALGLRSGVWAFSFLETILVLTFIFAILYSASTLFGVLTQSPIASILLTCGLWVVIFVVWCVNSYLNVFRLQDRLAQAVHDKYGDAGLGAVNFPLHPRGPAGDASAAHLRYEDFRFEENGFTRSVTFLYHALPRSNDLFALNSRQLEHDLAFGEPFPPPEKDEPLELPGGLQIKPIEARPSLAAVFGVSFAYIAVMLGVACFWFATKDY